MRRAWRYATTRTWWHLRSVGEVRVLRVSYFAIALIPLLARQDRIQDLLGLPRYVLALGYFSSCALMVATFIYDVGCPNAVRMFAMPADFFAHSFDLSVKARDGGVRDLPEISYEASIAEYNAMASRSTWLRLTCFVFYTIAAVTFGALLVDRSVRVGLLLV